MTTTEMIEEPEVERGPHWVSRAAFPVVSGLFFLSQGLLGLAVYYSNYWLAVPLALIASHLMHGMLIGFHEASHGLLRKNRFLNNLDGTIIGIFSLMSFSLYRAAHQLHHAYLASERDDELWPFIHPTSSRFARISAAILELTMGLLFTPFLFIRTFLRRDSPIRNKKLRRRIWWEFALTAAVWAIVLTVDAVFGLWKYFLWQYFIPGWLAANMQSLRKYVEHVGLTGATLNSATRSIVADGWFAKALSFTLLHEPYHGVHHWRSGLPHAELPLNVAALEPRHPEDRPPFTSYRAALWDLIVNLGDPRVGAQWHGGKMPTRREVVQQQGLN
jgi:fatty acid desaturase